MAEAEDPALRPTLRPPPRDAGEAARLDLIEVLATTAHARLRALTMIGVVAFGTGALIALILPALLGRPAWEREVMGGLCAFLTLVSAGVWRFAARTRPAASTILIVGLAYVTVAALAMAVTEVAIGPKASATYDGIPGMCIWIVLFPLVIPCMPAQALVTALACATTLPLAYAVAVAFGRPPSDPAALVRWFSPGFFCAGVAFAAAWVFGRLAGDLARARREVRELGAYQLETRLGSGGMGEVWRARHRLLPRSAAVKFVRLAEDLRHDRAAAAELARRFEREAKAIALLRSPHTVQIYDFGIGPDGDLFYAMELLDGVDLESLVARHGPLPEARAAQLIAQACLSLAEAHGNGLVHRDVKPGNLMLCRLGEDLDVVKVLDFGLVGAAQHAAPATSAAPAQTGFAGTPGYIAPELIFGSSPADARSDLYGLGATLYWLLTGSTVFPAANGGEDLVAHSMDRPRPPGERSGRTINPALEMLVMECLAKRPEQRPASALAVRERLRAIAFTEPWDDARARAWWADQGCGTSAKAAGS